MLWLDKYGFKESEITLMLDHESVPSHLWPTGDNIVSRSCVHPVEPVCLTYDVRAACSNWRARQGGAGEGRAGVLLWVDM